jgi:hypothetical protein
LRVADCDLFVLCTAAAARLEYSEGLADGGDIVNADDLDALAGEGEGAEGRGGCAVGLLVADELAEKGFARVADEEWAAEVVEAPTVGHERDVVVVGFAEADAGVEADALAVDSRSKERVTSLAQKGVYFRYDIGVAWIVLHGLRRAAHVHGADAGGAGAGQLDGGRIGEGGYVVDDLRAGIYRSFRDSNLGGVN